VRLSEELTRKRTAFPLEVHALMARFPPTEDADRLFRTLSRKLESALHQRLYQALLLLRHWIHLHERGRGEDFPRSPQYQTLKGLVANFRFRLPLLRALFVRAGVVLDVAESGAEALPGGERRVPFPVEDFGRAWGQFAAHAVLAGHLAERRVKGFDGRRYWEQVNGRLRARIDEGRPVDSLGYLLGRLYERAGGDGGLPVLAALARDCPPSFRFAVVQALCPPPDKRGAPWLDQLDAWADSVLQARESSLANAIVAESAAPG
jgi:hypothetical protein